MPSSSMTPTLRVGEHFFVDKQRFTTHSPNRGEVVVYFPEANYKVKYVKRVVGIPGDRIQMKHGTPQTRDQLPFGSAHPAPVNGGIKANIRYAICPAICETCFLVRGILPVSASYRVDEPKVASGEAGRRQ